MVLAIVLAYEIFSVFGVGIVVRRMSKKNAGEEFVNAGRSLNSMVVGVTLALTYIGSLHVFGVMELSWGMGMAAMWVSVGHVVMLCVICLFTGRWVRRTMVETVPELLEKVGGPRVRVATSCANAAVVFGLLSMESQCMGIVLAALTGLTIQQGAIIGGILGIFYVFLAGIKEIGIINVINTVVTFSGLIVTGLVLGGVIPTDPATNLAGWDRVQHFFETSGGADKLKMLGTTGVVIAFGIPTLVATTFAQSINQMGLQVCIAAKSERTILKALIIAGVLNGVFTTFTVIIGMASQAIPEMAALGPKLAGPGLIVSYLPPWLVAWLCAAFLGALLSTFSTNVLAPATLFVKDIYVNCTKSTENEAEQTKKIRGMIIILGIIAVCISFFLPEIVEGANWMFSWLIPGFWIMVFGLFWKRSQKAAEITLFGTWIVNFFWTFTPLKTVLNMGGVLNAYVTLVLSLALGIIANLVLPGEPGLFKVRKAVRNA
jgi:SSS family solute:Na+ symporter